MTPFQARKILEILQEFLVITILGLELRSLSTSTIICLSLLISLMIGVQQHLGSIPICCLPRA